MYVTGRLLPSGQVQARIQYVEEALDEEGDSNRPPRVSSQSLNSEVYIQPGQTVILGGFDNTVTQQQESGVPVYRVFRYLVSCLNTPQKANISTNAMYQYHFRWLNNAQILF